MVKDLIDFGILLIIYFLLFYRKWRARGKDVLVVNTAMYIYLTFVLYFTLMPIITSLPFILDHAYVPMNLVPFIDVSYGRGDFIRQIILNIVMTMPFGFLLPLVKPSYATLPRVILCTFLLSLSIELLQPLISGFRSSDITDIITNVLGGMIGYGAYIVFRPLTNRVLKLLRSHPAPTEDGVQ